MANMANMYKLTMMRMRTTLKIIKTELHHCTFAHFAGKLKTIQELPFPLHDKEEMQKTEEDADVTEDADEDSTQRYHCTRAPQTLLLLEVL